MAYVNRRQQIMKQRRESTALAEKKRKEKNQKRKDQLGGLSAAQFNKQNSSTGGKKTAPKSTKSTGNFVTYRGKRVLKTSAMGKKAIADQKRKSLASKNYMSKEMIEKRKKRLKIKK